MDVQASVATGVQSSVGSTSGMHSTTVTVHAAGSDQDAESRLSEQASQIPNYQSIEENRGDPPAEGAERSGCERCCTKCTSYRQKGTVIEHLVYFCALSVASYIGVVTRIYLALLAQWNGVPYFHSLYPEIVGTAIMGFIGSHKRLLQVKHKLFYQAVATGLCGSITTFSSWNSEAATILLQIDQQPADNVTRIVGWFTTLLLGIGMPIVALQFGKHIACLSPWSDQRLSTQEDSAPMKRYVIIEGAVFVIAWVVLTIIGVTVPFAVNRYDLLFSIVFSAFGTYTRWHLSPLNSAFEQFKLGTFIVNVLGSWVLGSVAVSKRYLATLGISEQDIVHHVLAGLGTGFCGCLTTVSTFAVELTTLSLRGTYLYALSSILLAQVGLIVIRGPYEWASL